MIKFLRKIRQKMLIDNKFSKYLIYAIGEIILVVIGILIALQINNWNEHQKELKQEKVIMSNLNNEFIENDKSLNKHSIRYQKSKESIHFLMSLIGQSENEIAKYNIDSLLSLMFLILDLITHSLLSQPKIDPSIK